MPMPAMPTPEGREAAETLSGALGRRALLQAAAAVGAIGTVSAAPVTATAATPTGADDTAADCGPVKILQPGEGHITGDHYLSAKPDQVRWGYVPAIGAKPVLEMGSGHTITIDTLSHEGILEDQGRNPLAYFGSKGVPHSEVLRDAVSVAKHYDRTRRDFNVDGPHVVIGPVFVKGAKPGDVLKVETLSARPRVPYGVVSSRHGKGALAQGPNGSAPPGITRHEVLPPIPTDHRKTGHPTKYGNVSVFTPIERHRGHLVGVMDRKHGSVQFPLNLFMGMMGVASQPGKHLKEPQLNSIPPTLGGGNIDISKLRVGSAFYLPVFSEGALFYVGDPHMAMGDGEVALTAMEGSLRATFRLTVCKRGQSGVPSVAFHYPFAETEKEWIAIGLSDPNGIVNGQVNDLDIAMRRAVVNALDFLQHDLGMDRMVAYAYLSAAADFVVSQVVDRTVGVHGVISKSHFR